MFGFEIYFEGQLIYGADEFMFGRTEEEAKEHAEMVIFEDITEREGYEGLGIEDFEIEIIEIED